MRTLLKLAVAAVAACLLAGCGGEDFTGAYRNGQLVLNVQGSQATIFSEVQDRIDLKSKFKVSVKGEKLFLDSEQNSVRVVMTRNVDEQSLDCLNCKVMGMAEDKVLWKYESKGPYDVDQLLKEQSRKDKEEAARLSTYEGALENLGKVCRKNGLSPKFCECMPPMMKKMGVSEAAFIKFTNQKFKPLNQAEVAQSREYGHRVQKASAQCMAQR